jgi:hypothetical protein
VQTGILEPNGNFSVRDENHCTIVRYRSEQIREELIRDITVDAGCWLVKDDDRKISKQHARKRDTLSLTTGRQRAELTQLSIEAPTRNRPLSETNPFKHG